MKKQKKIISQNQKIQNEIESLHQHQHGQEEKNYRTHHQAQFQQAKTKSQLIAQRNKVQKVLTRPQK